MAKSDPYELLLGRGTYEIFAAHWPYDEGPIANQLNSTRKHVASRTLKKVEWNNSALISGEVAEYVAELKSQDGPEVQVHGSPGLIQTLLEHDLIDEYRLWIFPVVIGAGKRFFGDGVDPGALKLVNSWVSSTGVTINTYERAGDDRNRRHRVRESRARRSSSGATASSAPDQAIPTTARPAQKQGGLSFMRETSTARSA